MAWERNHELTPREREILLWSCRGKTFADSAAILGISTASIKTYLDHARFKLNAVNITQAAAIAVAIGIFSPAEILNRPEAADPPPDPANTPPPPQSPPTEPPPRPA
jgi:DNA-binding CsgD family transcriptional regulator